MTFSIFVGSANRSNGQIRPDCGISVLSFDEARLDATLLHVEAAIDNPSYLAIDTAADHLYAVSEVGEWLECTVSAYRIDSASGRLTYINKQPTRGLTTCHVALLPGQRLGVANYSHGAGGPDQALCLYPLEAYGAIGAPDFSAAHGGPLGPDTARQERSHAHCILPTPDGKALLVTDLGLDAIIGYDAARPGRELFRLSLPAGSGPRHITAHPDGGIFYVLNELRPTISVLGWDEQTLAHLGDVATLESEPGAPSTAGAAIHVSPDGAFLYASTRGVDCISTFALAGDGRRPERRQIISCGGQWPRSFALTPSGAHVVVANQFSDELAILARDAQSGLLSDTGRRIAVPAPQCVKIVALA